MKSFSFKLLTVFLILHCTLSDPFLLLGIPQLNPSQMFKEDNSFFRQKLKPQPSIKSIEDLTKYIRTSKLEENEGLKIISNFLISDDPILRKEGAIFDLTGHDGLYYTDVIPKGNKEVLEMKARSAAHLYFMKNYKEEYDAYGVDDISKDHIKNWKIFKVLLMGRNHVNEHMFLSVCLSNDEMLPPLVTTESVKCEDKVSFI